MPGSPKLRPQPYCRILRTMLRHVGWRRSCSDMYCRDAMAVWHHVGWEASASVPQQLQPVGRAGSPRSAIPIKHPWKCAERAKSPSVLPLPKATTLSSFPSNMVELSVVQKFVSADFKNDMLGCQCCFQSPKTSC